VWAVNLTTLELHPFLSRAADLAAPTALVLDLDPGPPAGMLEACRVGLLLRAALDALGLPAYAKTSGGKGLHVFVPVSGTTYAATKALARQLARDLVSARPDLVVDRMTRSLRVAKVLVDWSQNDPGKSTVAPWSARGSTVPAVSMPCRGTRWRRPCTTATPRPCRSPSPTCQGERNGGTPSHPSWPEGLCCDPRSVPTLITHVSRRLVPATALAVGRLGVEQSELPDDQTSGSPHAPVNPLLTADRRVR
jgi:hypothetical protein